VLVEHVILELVIALAGVVVKFDVVVVVSH
jgi:hypothetical protein